MAELMKKRRRDQERIAMEEMKRCVDFGDGLQAENEFGLICGWTPYYFLNVAEPDLLPKRPPQNPLKRSSSSGRLTDYDHGMTNNTKKKIKVDRHHHRTLVQTSSSASSSSAVLPKTKADRIARFTELISKSQHQLGLLDHQNSLRFTSSVKQPPLITISVDICSTKTNIDIVKDGLEKKKLQTDQYHRGCLNNKKRRCKSKLDKIRESFRNRPTRVLLH